MAIGIHLSSEVHISLAILNLVICASLIIVRVNHWKKEKNTVPKLSVTGLSCMLVGFLTCWGNLNSESGWYFGDYKWCELSIKLDTVTYTLHRVLLYTFIILRLEVVNKSAYMNPRIIKVGKVVICVAGTFTVLTSTLSAKGIRDERYNCLFYMNSNLLVMLFVVDTSVCVGGTWVFLRPLWLTLKHIDSESVRYMVNSTTSWSLICLMSTLTSMLTIAIFDGSAGVVAFDCSVTCFSLVMMMSPVKSRLLLKKYQNSRHKASVEVEEMSSDVHKKTSSGEEPSTEILDTYFQKVLSERGVQQV